MSQAEMNSMGKITLGSTDKRLVETIITLFWNNICMYTLNFCDVCDYISDLVL